MAHKDWPVRSFKSSPENPPYVNITKNGPTATGEIFVAPSTWPLLGGNPTIYDNDGELIWQGPHANVSYFREQKLNGQPVLTYWTGNESIHGFGSGMIHVLDNTYKEIHQVILRGKETWVSPFLEDLPSYIDKHENEMTDRGSIIVIAVNATYVKEPEEMNLPPHIHWVQDGLIYEIDVESNEVLFRWSMLDHPEALPPAESLHNITNKEEGTSQARAWDFAHMNGATRYGDNYILSAKRSNSIYGIGKDGTLQWKLNGQTGGDFTLGPGTQFGAQHNPRVIRHTPDVLTVSLHNNARREFSTTGPQTTGLVLDIHLKSKRVTLNRRVYDSADPVRTQAQGNYQALPNGHVFMGHGFVPKFEEFDDQGACVMRGRLGHDNVQNTYSAFRAPWTGLPSTRPAVFACQDDQTTLVYVSWNGATGVQEWEVSAEKEAGAGLRHVTAIAKNGFETLARLDGAYARVMAMSVGGPNHGKQSETVSVRPFC